LKAQQWILGAYALEGLMIVRNLRDLAGTDRDIQTESLKSRRLLLARDGTSYSLHDTIIHAGVELQMWYKNHIESVYCVGGEGEVEDVETGEVVPLEDGTLYCLNDHDRHILRAKTDLRLICVFTPALIGPEIHDEEGAFPLLPAEPVPGGPTKAEAVAEATALVAAVKPRTRKPRRAASP
jgi:L-ectoine synthase